MQRKDLIFIEKSHEIYSHRKSEIDADEGVFAILP
jgi:hypothetical protein